MHILTTIAGGLAGSVMLRIHVQAHIDTTVFLSCFILFELGTGDYLAAVSVAVSCSLDRLSPLR